MNKGLLYGCAAVGSIIGSYIPVLWHASLFSFASILAGFIGTFVGIWAAFKINNYVDF